MPDVAEFTLSRASSMWADRAYGYPGDGINAFLGAYGKIDAPQFIQARHEEMAALWRVRRPSSTARAGPHEMRHAVHDRQQLPDTQSGSIGRGPAVSAWPEAPAIKSVEATAFTIPTDRPERDGTLEWSQTTLLLVRAQAGGRTGIGYSYADPAAAGVVNGKLAGIVCGRDPLQVGGAWARHVAGGTEYRADGPGVDGHLRGRRGAVDLKARLRIEHLAFDGCLEPEAGGVLRPDRTRPGLGLEVRWPDLERWRVR